MNCPHCRSVNDNADSRCARCGRRLHPASARPAPEGYSSYSATATALQIVPDVDVIEAIAEHPPSHTPSNDVLPIDGVSNKPGIGQPVSHRPEPVNYQTAMFTSLTGGPKVVPIPTLTPYRPLEREGQPRSKSASPSAPRQPRRSSDQQHLDLQDAPRERAAFEEAICCDALVAQPSHRLLAAAVDGGLILSGVAIIATLFMFAGGHFALTRADIAGFFGVIAAVAILYRALWSIADGDTPGMRFAGLRLVDFDGRRANRNQRVLRQAAGVLSLIAAGVGLVWALLDEESLTWHDHISKTFPTIGV